MQTWCYNPIIEQIVIIKQVVQRLILPPVDRIGFYMDALHPVTDAAYRRCIIASATIDNNVVSQECLSIKGFSLI
ncbi:MAG: hypothetical protein WCK32_07725 [Chlorobiaceae bacterium]